VLLGSPRSRCAHHRICRYPNVTNYCLKPDPNICRPLVHVSIMGTLCMVKMRNEDPVTQSLLQILYLTPSLIYLAWACKKNGPLVPRRPIISNPCCVYLFLRAPLVQRCRRLFVLPPLLPSGPIVSDNCRAAASELSFFACTSTENTHHKRIPKSKILLSREF
jgi:hypothetical protein